MTRSSSNLTDPLPADLHEYEKDFLQAFANDDLADRRKGLQEMTVKLVNSVSDKMKGFSRKETIDYYKSIMERAWQQIEAAGTPEVKSQMYDEALEWTMLDKNYDERTRRVFTGPIFVPMWWGRYDPGYRPVSTGAVPSRFHARSVRRQCAGQRARLGLCRLGRDRRPGLLQPGARRREVLHLRRHQPHQPGAGRQELQRRWSVAAAVVMWRLCLCLRLRRLRLCLCGWRTVGFSILD